MAILISLAIWQSNTRRQHADAPNPKQEKYHGTHQPRYHRIGQSGTEGPLRRHPCQARHGAQLPWPSRTIASIASRHTRRSAARRVWTAPRLRPTAPAPAAMKKRPSPSGLRGHWSPTWAKSRPQNCWKCATPATANPISSKSLPTLGKAGRVDIDFPKVELKLAA